MAKADDYCGAKSCGCRADEYDPAYWDYVRKESDSKLNKDGSNKETTNKNNDEKWNCCPWI